jgi:transcriptional regulator with XRE-family HTH domain
VGRSVEDVDRRKDIQEFLTSRRARLTPEQAGLARFGDRRRVTGLRREEVAMLAGVSMDYYARLERGHLTGASESVLEAVARALQLDEAERQHLLDLARNSEITMSRPPRRPKPSAATPRPAVMAILAGMTGIPAYVRTPRMEIVAANELCQALYGGVLDDGRLPLNLARYLFLDPHSRGFFLDWDAVADDLIGALRVQAGRDPRDRALSDLIGELSTRSDDFVARWARQNVRLHRTARKRLHNRVVGEIELTGNALELPGDDLILIAYTADPGSQAEDQLKLLVTWAAGEKPATTRPDPAQPSPSHD